jgi:hydrogenase nickel incorporation protein HypA/HybF
MHEMGIAMEILKIVQSSIPAEMTGARVRRVNLKIGRMSTIVPESLRFCFGVVAENTPVANAELAITEIAVQAQCTDCNHQWQIESPIFVCPACSSGKVEMLTGRELDIDSIELEEQDNTDANPQ